MTEKIYILSELNSHLGNATEAEIRLELEGFDNAYFISKGRRVGTPRLVKELARNYGVFADWLPGATADQLELLGFVGAAWLRIAVWAGRQAEVHYEAYASGNALGGAERDTRKAKAAELVEQARRTRERLRTSLLHLAGGISTWEARIHAAYTTSVTAFPACDSLLALCDVADKILVDASKGITDRLAHSTLKAAVVKKYRDLGTAALNAAKEAAAIAPTAPVSQADVDLWDGIALVFFEQFVDAVELAREDDPTIPAPSIIGLRTLFGRTARKKADEGNDPTPPAGA